MSRGLLLRSRDCQRSRRLLQRSRGLLRGAKDCNVLRVVAEEPGVVAEEPVLLMSQG